MQIAIDYFTEVEQYFLRRRGRREVLSALEWALVETWHDAGVPIEAVLRGIDAAFEKIAVERNGEIKQINSLAFCTNFVLQSASDMKQAMVGAHDPALSAKHEEKFRQDLHARIPAFLRKNAQVLRDARWAIHPVIPSVVEQCVSTLEEMAAAAEGRQQAPRFEDLDRHLVDLEEKLLPEVIAATPAPDLELVRAEAEVQIQPYRGRMPAAQIERLREQCVHKLLFARMKLPRLSLFYMG